MDAWLRQVCFTMHSFTVSMSKQLFCKGLQLFCSGVTIEGSFFGLVVAGYGCRGAVLQTEQYNEGGAVLQQ